MFRDKVSVQFGDETPGVSSSRCFLFSSLNEAQKCKVSPLPPQVHGKICRNYHNCISKTEVFLKF